MSAGHKRAIEGRHDLEVALRSQMIDGMTENLAYTSAREEAGGDPDGSILERFRDRYLWYRQSWRDIPAQAVSGSWTGERFVEASYPPLCVDVEVAAVCDLACPFCFRQHIATPDKIIDTDFCADIIDQACALGVPSMKFNWRGEPLLHPQLPDLIRRAKRGGILETIINTNATRLDEKMARDLIEAGLDVMVYSFDGGSKETYERMRPGRFSHNSFDEVYANIKRFKTVRDEMGRRLPRTKIQMILTEETSAEQDRYFELFEPYVDDVSVKQYTERGAGLSDLPADDANRLKACLSEKGLADTTPYLRDMGGEMWFSPKRRVCEQPFQRLMVTYDGKVAMCCYDWGATHPIGYLSDASFPDPDGAYRDVLERVEARDKGFESLKNIKMPSRLNHPPMEVSSMEDIWRGREIDVVRSSQLNNCGHDLKICGACKFKDAYVWEPVEGEEA